MEIQWFSSLLIGSVTLTTKQSLKKMDIFSDYTWCENTLSLPSTSVITPCQLSYETRLSDFSDAILALLLSLMSRLDKKKNWLIVQRKETKHFNTRKCLETMDSAAAISWRVRRHMTATGEDI